MKNKRGVELLSIWWFIVLAFVTVSVVAGVWAYYSVEINMNEFEAGLLADKLANCFSQEGFTADSNYIKDFDVFKNCGLKKEVFDAGSNFFFRVSVVDAGGTAIKAAEGGDASFEAECEVTESGKIEAKHFPKCVRREYSAICFKGESKESCKIKIIAGSNQKGKKKSLF